MNFSSCLGFRYITFVVYFFLSKYVARGFFIRGGLFRVNGVGGRIGYCYRRVGERWVS